MADMDRTVLNELVTTASEGLELEIQTRSGCTHDLMCLRKVAVGRAKCVIWLEPKEDEVAVAAMRAAAIAGIKTLGTGQHNTARIIVQTSEDSAKSKFYLTDVPLAYRSPPPKPTSKLQVVEMYEETNLDRLLAQCALQPQLTDIISNIFQHNDGKEFYIIDAPQFSGKYYSEARRHFNSAMVCGVSHTSSSPFSPGAVFLNPPEDYVLHQDDSLVVLCSTLWKAAPSTKPLPKPEQWVTQVKRQHSRCESQNIVILCFGKEGSVDSGILEALGMFAPKGTKVTLVATSHNAKSKSHGNCLVQYVNGNPNSFKTLQSLKSHKIDTVVLAGLEDLPPQVADAQFVSSLIQIQEVANVYWEDKRGFSIVGPVSDAKTEQVIHHLISEGKALPVPIKAAILLPTELASGILVQVAGYPQLDLVFKDLLNSSGSELYVRAAEDFGLVGRGPINILAVSDVMRQHHETFLGILKKDGSLEIATEALKKREFVQGDKIIVLADSFNPKN